MTGGSESRWTWLVVVVVPALVYANSLGNPFQYDDSHSIIDNPHIRSLANLPTFFIDPTTFSEDPALAMYRPLLLATFSLNYAIGQYSPRGYHVVSLLLHLGCVSMVFAVGELLLRSRSAAALAALVFGVHTANTESVNYISSRSEILAGLLVLATLWGFLKLRAGSGNLAGPTITFAGALLSKSIAIATPALLLCHDLLRPQQHRLKRDYLLYGWLGFIGLGYLAVVARFLKKATLDDPVRPFAEQFWTQVKAFVFYAKLLVFPWGLNVDHQFQISDTFADPFALSAALLLGSVCLVCWCLRPRTTTPLLLLLWFLLSLLPASLVPLNVLVNEHRLYLPSAIFGLGLGALLAIGQRGRRLTGSTRRPREGGSAVSAMPRAAKAATVVALVALAALTIQRNRIWQDVYILWNDAAAKAPLMARPHIMLALEHSADGNHAAAARSYEEVRRLDPGYATGYLGLGNAYVKIGMPGRAEEAYRSGLRTVERNAELYGRLGELYRVRAMSAKDNSDYRKWFGKSLDAYVAAVGLEPDDVAMLNNLGSTYQELGRPREALPHHERARLLSPDDAPTHLNLGNARSMVGDQQGAREAYARAAEIDPSYGEAWLSLLRQAEAADSSGQWTVRENADLWGRLGELYRVRAMSTQDRSASREWFRKSLDAYVKAVGLAPDDVALLNDLGTTYQALGKPRDALEHHERARRLNPRDAPTHLNLGNARSMVGDHQGAREAYVRAVEIDPQYGEAWLSLGALLEANGDARAALAVYEKGSRVDGEYGSLARQRYRALAGGSDE